MPENRKTQERIDPRSAFVLDAREVGRRPGSIKRLRRPVSVPDALGLELIRVPAGTALDLDLRLEAVMEGILASGTVTAELRGECGRCLGPVSDSLVVRFQELFVYPDRATSDDTDEDGVRRLHGDLLNLEPTVRDAVVLALPLTPLCRENCPGLCAGCGVPWDDLPGDHTHDLVDPRWAALRQMYPTSPEQATDSQET